MTTRTCFFGLSVCAVGALLLALAGCDGDATQGKPADSPAIDEGVSGKTADELLKQLRSVYARARSYRDEGQFFIRLVEGGREFDQGPIPFQVAFERPNKLRIQAFTAMVGCNGEICHAAAGNIPAQVLEREAPQVMTLSALGGDEILDHALRGGMESLVMPQLELLLGDPERGVEKARLLEPQKLDGIPCQLIELTGDDGARVLWIDEKGPVLKRVDLPTQALRKELDPEGKLEDVQIWANLVGAELDVDLPPAAFELDVPESTRRLSRLVPPVSPPPQRLGEQIGPFELTDLEGAPFDRTKLAKGATVIDFWFTTCGWCQVSMPHLETLYEKYKDRDGVAFYAVSTDSPDVDAETLVKALKSWGASMPILRDGVVSDLDSVTLPASIRDVQVASEATFQIPGAPCLFVLDKDGVVHHYQAGYQPDSTELEATIEGLLAGENVARHRMARHEAEVEAFEAELAAAAVDAGSDLVEVPHAEVAARADGKYFRLVEEWRAKEIKAPGNILVVDGPVVDGPMDDGPMDDGPMDDGPMDDGPMDDGPDVDGDETPGEEGPPRILALDGWRTVVELDAEGAEIKRSELAIPDRSVATFLRTAVDAAGKRYFAGSAVSQQKVYLFDDEFELLLSFPEGRHAGIADVQLADLAADGTPEMLIGYWGIVGVQAVSLEGKRDWTNRSLENVMQIALDEADESGKRRALCINSRGTVLPIDHEGRAGSDIRVGKHALINVVTSDVDGDGKLDRCGLAADPEHVGITTAVGFDADGTVTWTYDLPKGYHETPVGRIIPARLAEDDGGWILPAADGTIHLLTAAGERVDKFAYGDRLRGLALVRHQGKPLLLVASDGGLAAWRLEKK